MEKILSNQEIAQLVSKPYQWQAINGDELLILNPEGQEPFDIVLPNHLPLNREGHPFVPGIDCCDGIPIALSVIGSAMQLDHKKVGLDIATGNYRPQGNGAKPHFRPAAPHGSTHLIIVIDHFAKEHKPPRMITPESEIGQELNVVASWRVGPFSSDDYPQDFIVIDKQADQHFQPVYQLMDGWISDEIIAGDVFMATAPEAASIYRRYMEQNLLSQLSPTKGTPIILTPKLRDDYCELWCHDPSDDRDKIFDIYEYTLSGTQKMAQLINGDVESQIEQHLWEVNF